ncbi:hypothetical protein N2599_37335 (plasmid) [Rhizobium sullae]|uniref:Uncharacterized protein n=1 Tax=Rhizobium sullae TaxID=50338 RepID=A0ABY5XY99_RHISU|nr:hypothetical protein [Rhizobium sullae]UWU19620.1 hypothetical protein N2599_37335 [Rhizobium sullae]
MPLARSPPTAGLCGTRAKGCLIAQIKHFRILRILVLTFRKQFGVGALIVDILVIVRGVQ